MTIIEKLLNKSSFLITILSTYCCMSTYISATDYDEELYQAAKTGDVEAASRALKLGANIEAAGYMSELSPLMVCSLHGHFDVCKLLLDNKARVNFPNSAYTPLGLAVSGGHKDIVKLLLSKKANINDPCDVNMGGEVVYATPLMIAIWNDDLEMMELLLQNKADPNLIVSHNNRSAVYVAVGNNRIEAMKTLIKYKVKTTVYNMIMSDGTKVSPAHYAIEKGQKEMASLIINSQKKPEPHLLVAAIDMGDTETAQLLLERGADPKYVAYTGENAFVAAIRTQNEELIPILMPRVNINAVCNGETALCKAAESGNLELVSKLLSLGARQDIRLRNGWTPLIYALWHKHEEVALLLINRGARLDTKVEGYSVTMLAVMHDFYRVAEKSINRKNANETFAMDGNRSLLDFAAVSNNVRMVELLLNNGAQIDRPDTSGDTPLMNAIRKSSVDAAKILLQRGASTKVKNKNGQTARQLAQENRVDEILKLMDR